MPLMVDCLVYFIELKYTHDCSAYYFISIDSKWYLDDQEHLFYIITSARVCARIGAAKKR